MTRQCNGWMYALTHAETYQNEVLLYDQQGRCLKIFMGASSQADRLCEAINDWVIWEQDASEGTYLPDPDSYLIHINRGY